MDVIGSPIWIERSGVEGTQVKHQVRLSLLLWGVRGVFRDLGELKTYFLLVLFSVYELIP